MFQKKYSAFTLIEMLIVMGILVILMAMGIAAGRFAIQRANQVQHQNAVDQLYQALQSYYADNRSYPDLTTFGTWKTALGTGGVLAKYVDSFDGGSDATYYYTVDATGQSVLVCSTFGGYSDASKLGGYCNGNGFSSLPLNGTTKVSKKNLTNAELVAQVINVATGGAGTFSADGWISSTKLWQ